MFLPQIADLINQFNTIVLDNGVNVITDRAANMYMDIPKDMPQDKADYLIQKIELIDRLINTRTSQVEDLLKEGSSLELGLKKDNPEFKSTILDKLTELNRLKSLYKH
jgi:hypothetical protein